MTAVTDEARPPTTPPDAGEQPSLAELTALREALIRPAASAGHSSSSADIAGTALVILAALFLSFAASISLLGAVSHARDQQTVYATLRNDLANATGVVGQFADDGKPQPLGRPMAVLDIPQIGVREVVLEGTTGGVLRSGPGHRRDTPLPGQAGISLIYGRAAAYGGPFKHLDQMKQGEVFTIATAQGRNTFRTIGVRRAGDPQPPPPVAGKGRITLVTATGPPFVPEGLLRVDADLVSTVQPARARPITYASLPAAERPMGADQTAWVPILLLVQALLLVSLLVSWLRTRWGAAQVWLAGMPVVLALGVALSGQVARLLPNLM